ncbi:MAG: Ig-like domain-containing protein, partial [Oscillospiraceae bacterium]|nr:Ig-like domain-containing protein [Oscillospiraceae bacterium]
DETIAMLYFDLAETAADGTEIKGGNFPLQFLWEGLDNSQAFWYTDTQTNRIDAIRENSLDGKVSFFNPDSELISESDIRLSPGYQHSLEVLNAGGDIIWFSSDDSVAVVDENGLVTAVAPGECQIHAFINEHIFSCNVSVTSEVYHLISDNGAVNITDQTTIHIMEYPGALGKVNWMSVKPSIVSIDPDGTMHANDNGVVNILGTYNGKTLMRIVNVDLNSSEPMTDPVTEPETTTTEPEITTETITESDNNEFLGKPQSGDVNGDGETNISDVVLCNRIYVGVEHATHEQIQAGDMDNSGKLDLSDSMTILKILVGLIEPLV